MSTFLDILTVIVFIIAIYRAYRKGFVRALVEILGFAAAFVVSFFLSEPLGNFIDNAFLKNFIHSSVSQIAKSGSQKNADLFAKIAGSIPSAVEKSLSGINEGLGQIGKTAMDNVVNAVSVPLAQLISRGIAFFLILIVCFTVIQMAAHMSSAFSRVPVFGSLNALAGAAIGIAEAFLIMFFISTFISIAISLCSLQKNPPLTTAVINSTSVYKYIHNINPITGMLLKK